MFCAAGPLPDGSTRAVGFSGKAKRGSSRSVSGFQAVLPASTRATPSSTGAGTTAGLAATSAANRGSSSSPAKSGSAASRGKPA